MNRYQAQSQSLQARANLLQVGDAFTDSVRFTLDKP